MPGLESLSFKNIILCSMGFMSFFMLLFVLPRQLASIGYERVEVLNFPTERPVHHSAPEFSLPLSTTPTTSSSPIPTPTPLNADQIRQASFENIYSKKVHSLCLIHRPGEMESLLVDLEALNITL
jgi:hypothetical protein